MAPPPLRQFASTSAMSSRHVTEDTPPDLLEGTMDLTVILPAGHRVNMSIHRSTPMMDLLIQVTTAHKVNPGGHIIHVVSDNRLISYKPSTPIGTLDTNVIHIVPKNKVNEEAKKRRAHLVTQAIEKNIRLKVNLPRNQLAVYRVPPKTLISDVLTMVCKDRCLDLDNHEIRHPVNVDEKLRGSCTLADYQLQEVCVVPRDFRAPPLSVTDLITMAAISHPEDKKRRTLLSLFSRKTKSSTGDSSLSSGSAGERSVSPARSDESADGRPTPRPLSPASSSATLTSSHPAPPLSRPASSLNLARARKRQAPAPPPAATPPAAAPPAQHTNGKAESERREGVGSSLSRRSSDSSGYHESEHRSPHTSPAGSEISSMDTSRGPGAAATNLTSVVSTSSLSLASSRGKRRAPPPPKPAPAKHDEARPSAIPEEAETPVPPTASEEAAPPRVNGEAEPASPPSSSTPQPPEAHPSSPTSSHVSSVSSLSSVEHQQASSPLLPPPPDVECPPPPPPPASASDCTNSGASFNASRPPSSKASDLGMTPSRSHSASTSSSSSSSFSNTPSPTTARATVAARVSPGMQHGAASAAAASPASLSNGSGASGVISPDRLAAPEGRLQPRPQDPQRRLFSSPPARPEDNRKRAAPEDAARTEDSHASKSARQQGSGRDSSGASAKSAKQYPEDAIVPLSANMENASNIPMFRIVTKSQTTVQQDEDVNKKFIADGKTQKMKEDDRLGSRGKASLAGRGNPLARGQLLKQQNVLFDDDDDDMDFNEDMFAPKHALGNSTDQSMEWRDFSDQSFGGGPPPASSTPVDKSTPEPVPRRTTPAVPQKPAPPSEPERFDALPSAANRRIGSGMNSSLEGGIAAENVETPPMPAPRNTVSRKKRAPPPPPVSKARVPDSAQDQVVSSVPKQQVLNPSLELSVRPKYSELPTSPRPHHAEAEDFDRIMNEPQDEEFKVHVSSLVEIEPDQLSLLTEVDVDSPSYRRSPASSVSSREFGFPKRSVEMDVLYLDNDVDVKSISSSSSASFHSSSPTPPPAAPAPAAAVPSQTTASSYRAGYLALISQLRSWDNTESLQTTGLDSSGSRSSTPRGSLQDTPAREGSPQRSSEDASQGPPSSRGRAHRGPSTRPRLVSSSSLCSDTDHEVQTRTASFSSETSEDNVVSSRVESTCTPSEESLEPNTDEKNLQEVAKNLVSEAAPPDKGGKGSPTESPSRRSSTSSAGEGGPAHDGEEIPASEPATLEATPPEANDVTGPQALTTRDSGSSQSDRDSDGDSRGDRTQELIREAPQDGIRGDESREEVETEVLEMPKQTVNVPKETKGIPNGSVDSSSDVSSGRHVTAATGSRKTSVSSMSSASSGDSGGQTERERLVAREAQEKSKKAIESHLEAAFADLDEESGPAPAPGVSVPPLECVIPKEPQVDTWEYKIPDPPTPFKDGPASKLTDESSSVSSDGPEVLSDVPSGFKDSPAGSIVEARNSVELNHVPKLLKVPGDTTDSASTASSRRSSTSSVSTSSNKFDERSKQSVINELKTTLKETNNNEPRIIELKPKAKAGDATLPAPKEVPAPETKAEVLPARANFPVDHSFVPRVVAKVPPATGEPRLALDHALIPKPRLDSLSSYESCNTPEPRDVSDSDASARDRSGSSTSYESAPPPVPEAPLPSESESERKLSRSSSEASDLGRRHDSESLDDYGLTIAPVMKFSISTYRSRAEETSYDKKITKSESFSHLARPKVDGAKGQLLKAESMSALARPEEAEHAIRTIPEVREEATADKPAAPAPPAAAAAAPEKPTPPEKPVIIEATLKPSQLFAKPVPPSKPSSLASGQPLGRINSFSDRPGIYRTSSIEGRFVTPDPFRPPRRLQRSDSQEQLGRANSMHNLATPTFDLRKAQSSYDIYSGSNGNSSNSGMPGMPGMPGMMGMPSLMGGGMMPHDARLADEFMKLQQDFFKWQQQLLQNQHVLHSRVAPLASNPPQLQSVGVLRDIMSQNPSDGGSGGQGVAEAYNPVMEAPQVPAPAPAAPRERIITIRMEGADGETDESKVPTQPAPRVHQAQVVHNITNDMSRLNTAPQPRLNTVQSRRWAEEPNVSVGSWVERPSQPVGVYQDQDYVTSVPRSQTSQDFPPSVGPEAQQQAFARPAETMSQERRPFQSAQPQQPQFNQPQQLHNLSPQQQQQFAQFLQQQQQQQQEKQQPQFMQQQQKQQPQFMQPVQSKLMPQQKQPSPTFMRPQQQKQPSPPLTQQQRQPSPFMQNQQQKQPSPPFSQAQQQKQPSPPPMYTQQQKQPSPPFSQPQQQKQPSPPFMQQQKHSSPQYLQQPKQPSPPKQTPQADVPQPERAAFWRELEARRQDLGLQKEPESPEPTRPPRRNSRQDSPPQDNVEKPLTYFGQQAVVQEPPQTYYYNGEGNPAAAKGNSNLAQRPREAENEAGPRYTSVVTLSSDKGETGNGAAAPRDKVRSVVQLNNDQRGQPRPAPVVRGFRQPSQPQSRSSVSPPTNSSVPAPLQEPVPQAPTAARLVAALSQPAPKAPSPSPMASMGATRVSPPRTSPSRVSPPRTSPSRVSPPSGPAFQNVQLRPVPGGSRGSTPPEVMPPPPAPVPPPPPPAPSNQAGGMPPPPPPPAPPMAPPPPPAPTAGDGERRTATGKRIVAPKTAPALDPREELMMAIRNHGGSRNLRKTHNMINH